LEEIPPSIQLSISHARDLGGKIVTLERDRLSLAPEKHYILSGTIQNFSEEEVPSGILEVSLADKIVDQQMVKKLKPGENRSFETSILSDFAEEKKLNLRVFDTPAKGKMLAMRELRLDPRGRGGGAEEPDLEIIDFEILEGPLETPLETERSWGGLGIYVYNGGGVHDSIRFRIRVLNQGSVDYSGGIGFTVGSGPVGVYWTGPLLELGAGEESGYYVITVNQSGFVERGDFSEGEYVFRARVQFWDDGTPLERRSSDSVRLHLIPPPVDLAETFALTSEPHLTGSINVEFLLLYMDRIYPGSGKWRRYGFVSFDLSPIQEQIEEWMREGWTGFSVWDATLELDQYAVHMHKESWRLKLGPIRHLNLQGKWWAFPCDEDNPWDLPPAEEENLELAHEATGEILLDHLDYGNVLTELDYDAPIISNIRAFQSACGIHSIPHLGSYVRFELERRRLGLYEDVLLGRDVASTTSRIQFRLRLPEDGSTHAVSLRKPCRLTVTVIPN